MSPLVRIVLRDGVVAPAVAVAVLLVLGAFVGLSPGFVAFSLSVVAAVVSMLALSGYDSDVDTTDAAGRFGFATSQQATDALPGDPLVTRSLVFALGLFVFAWVGFVVAPLVPV